MDHNQELVAALRRAVDGSAWVRPTTLDSWAFLVTEVGEVGDLLMRYGYGAMGYSRNNPTASGDVRDQLEHELGDVMVMLCTLANHLGINLTTALGKRVQHFTEKYGLQGGHK